MNEEVASRYIGLAIRSGEVVFGLDKMKEKPNLVKLIICCLSASSNLFASLNNLSTKYNIPIYQLKNFTINELIKTENCKAIGITNPNLAKQIKLVLEREQ